MGKEAKAGFRIGFVEPALGHLDTGFAFRDRYGPKPKKGEAGFLGKGFSVLDF